MREIKFRGYNGAKWLYSTEISGIPCFEEVHYFMPNKDNELTQEYIGNWDSVSYVGQYTGLKDKNGTEIYEGDLLKSGKANNIYEVFYSQGCFQLRKNDGEIDILAMYSLQCFEVIGNIYENKELLEEIR